MDFRPGYSKQAFISGRWLFAIFSLCFCLNPVLNRAEAASVTVVVTKQTPLTTLSPKGDVLGVGEATVGAQFTFVRIEGNQIVLQNAQGIYYRIAKVSTDYISGASPTSPSATTNNAPLVSPPAPVTNLAPVPSTSLSTPGQDITATSSAPIPDDAVAKINAGLGTSFFTTQSFWKESALLIASRLRLRLEDKTKWESSYRRYFYDTEGNYAPASILGGGAYCVALYSDADDTPTSALIAFANDGDYQGAVRILSAIYALKHQTGTPLEGSDQKIAELQAKFDAIRQSFEAARQKEQVTLTKNLTALFGDPRRTSFGSDAVTREDALRWDWNGVSFLLTCQENKYNLLRVIPTQLADNHGRTERIPRDELGPKLIDAVEHRVNGDVVITQIPMADQGLKGYCVPATWERVLRYTGVPGDMYTLSRIGGAGFSGGEGGSEVAAQLDNTLHNYGRKAQFIQITKIDAFSLRRYIDAGIPIFWGVNPGGYVTVQQRYALCDRDKDWEAWKKLLTQSRTPSTSKATPLENKGGHQVLITGYNPDTKEIAWSDPWGRNTQERWMTQEEAQRCSLNEFYIISW